MRKLKWIFGVLFILAAMIGCEKTDSLVESIDVPDGTLKSLQVADYNVIDELPLVCNYEEYELIGGQTIDVGDVLIANTEDFLYITIHVKDGFQAVEENVKIWLGDEESFFSKRPVSGKFPYKFTVTQGLDLKLEIPLAELGLTCDSDPIYAVIHVDAVVDNGVVDENGEAVYDEETAYSDGNSGGGKAWWFYSIYTPACCGDNPQVDPPTTCGEETAWGGDTPLNVGTAGAWWYYFDVNGEITQNIYAGQYTLIGTVTYDGETVTIDLYDNATLIDIADEDGDESVKIQGYTVETLPTVRPSAGHFT